MVLLIDANVILDVLMNREPHVKASSAVWKLCESERATGYASTLTFANLVYVMRKQLDTEKIKEILQKLNLIFSFVNLTGTDLTKAAELKWSDYEDALQSVTAERIRADYIITRNVKDFKDSSVETITPEDFLSVIREL